jgi:hypothetical protein
LPRGRRDILFIGSPSPEDLPRRAFRHAIATLYRDSLRGILGTAGAGYRRR